MIAKMVGLDWLSMKVYHKLLFISTPWILFVFSASNMSLIIPLCVMYFAMVSTWIFSVEEKGESHKLYLTLPVRKCEIVAGRYVLSFSVFICSILIGIIVMLIKENVNFFWFNIVSGESLNSAYLITVITASYLLNAFFNLCVFPIFYWLGYTKGKFLAYVIMFSIFFGFVILYTLMESKYKSLLQQFIDCTAQNIVLVNSLIFTAATFLLALSFFISVKVYAKRDM